MKNNILISKALTVGLLAGYGGKSVMDQKVRGKFTVKSSELNDESFDYIDQWTSGGGQELVRVGDEEFTRVYAGRVVDGGKLTELAINENKVLGYLMEQIQNLGGLTRLFEDCTTEKNTDGWKYEYKIIDRDLELDLTVGRETIYFREQIVFKHIFILSPIK